MRYLEEDKVFGVVIRIDRVRFYCSSGVNLVYMTYQAPFPHEYDIDSSGCYGDSYNYDNDEMTNKHSKHHHQHS